jgi:glycosyltransferase involved in cell wall biosynthesis
LFLQEERWLNVNYMKKNVVHFITGLKTGGSEMMLLKLLSASDQSKTNSLVVSLMDKGTIGERIEDLGIRVIELNLSRKSPITLNFLKLWFELRRFNPDVFQGWMYHANFLLYFFSWFFPQAIVYWGIRQSLYDIKNEKMITRIMINACKWFSYRCDKVVFNSKKSLEQHINYGFSRDNCEVIPNGFDVELFSPLNFIDNSVEIKLELSIPNDVVIVGIIARYHPMKGYENFIKAAFNVLKKHPNVHFVAIGKGVTNSRFDYLINDEHKASFHLLTERHDIPELISMFDIAVSSSIWGDAFSNSICEAMAMAVPCVVTDVGDSEFIVGDFGVVVEPGDVRSLSDGLIKMIEMSAKERKKIGKNARMRIVDNFSLERLNQEYESLYGI